MKFVSTKMTNTNDLMTLKKCTDSCHHTSLAWVATGGSWRSQNKVLYSHEFHASGRFSPNFFVKSSAFFMNFLRSFVYSSASSARSGCSGSGSLTRATKACITANKILFFIQLVIHKKSKQISTWM